MFDKKLFLKTIILVELLDSKVYADYILKVNFILEISY